MKIFESSKEDIELLKLAEEAKERAYCPYSNFRVGAALLTESGKVFTGCNVETSSYGLTICAERLAIFKAISEGEKVIAKIAIVTDSDRPCPPCGACRQVIYDFGKDAVLIMKGRQEDIEEKRITDLFPFPFGEDFL